MAKALFPPLGLPVRMTPYPRLSPSGDPAYRFLLISLPAPGAPSTLESPFSIFQHATTPHVPKRLAVPAPTLDREKCLWNDGYRHVAGLDEAGRGCLAGPVVAAAVMLSPERPIQGLQDSKKLSRTEREAVLKEINAKAVAVGVGRCSPQEIDELNILWAALEAMRRAASSCTPSPEYLLIDGNRCFPDCSWPHETLVKGDGRSQSIAAASIVAKTTRDRIMRRLHAEHPHYGWNTNVGYPTKTHYQALARHGPTLYHRHSFRLQRSS